MSKSKEKRVSKLKSRKELAQERRGKAMAAYEKRKEAELLEKSIGDYDYE